MILDGFDEVLADMEKAHVTVAVRAEEKVAEVAAKVEATAVVKAPKGERPHPKYPEKIAESMETTGDGTFREVGTTARHGWFMENGTYKDAPQPFLGPALDENESELVTGLEDVAGDI